MYIGSRRELIWTLRHRAERAEAEQELRVAQARSNERARIAREMHDVLAHRISQISMHAGALGYREDLDRRRDAGQRGRDPGEGARGAHRPARRARACCATTGPASCCSTPQPTYADLPRLVAEARESGLQVNYRRRSSTATATRCPTRSAGRSTGSSRRASPTPASTPPAPCSTIEVSGSPEDGIDVLLRNPLGFGPHPHPRRPGSGWSGSPSAPSCGGGRLEHRRDGSTFVLHGWIPWAA